MGTSWQWNTTRIELCALVLLSTNSPHEVSDGHIVAVEHNKNRTVHSGTSVNEQSTQKMNTAVFDKLDKLFQASTISTDLRARRLFVAVEPVRTSDTQLLLARTGHKVFIRVTHCHIILARTIIQRADLFTHCHDHLETQCDWRTTASSLVT